MEDDWISLQFPENLEEVFEDMSSYAGHKVG
jgi:hypothetical protein